MNEQNTKTIRPTKKQRELLSFIEKFITENGYSPSYREIMKSLDYNSVATVSLHVNSLIKRGHLRKRDRSARSLELTKPTESSESIKTNTVNPAEEKWLIEKVEYYLSKLERQGGELEKQAVDELHILIGALRVLGLDGASQSFLPRLQALRAKTRPADAN